jgi:hypothetical protein
VSGKASCELEKTELLVTPIELGVIDFQIGPVPIIINNTLNFTLEGSAAVGAKFHEGVKSVLSQTSSAQIDHTGLNPTSGAPTLTNTFESPTVTATGSAQFYLGARLNMLLYNVAGPFVEAALGPKLDIDTSAKPWWTLTLELKIGAGLRANFLDFKPIEDDHIYAHTFPIVDSTSIGQLTEPPVGGSSGFPDPGLPVPYPDPAPPSDPGSGGVPVTATGLDECLDNALDQTASDPITTAEMASLTTLDCSGNSTPITDISALVYATNLRELNLSNYNGQNTFTDLGPLAGMKKLITLDLGYNTQLTDISAITALASLTTLRYNGNNGAPDVSVDLLAFRGLSDLDISGTYLDHPGYLASLPALRELDAQGSPLDTSAMLVISHLALTTLKIGGGYNGASGYVEGVQDLGNMQSLVNLAVDNVDTPDPTFLLGLGSLRSLSYTASGISDVTAFAQFTQLTDLDLSSNYLISDIRPLAALKGLVNLDVSNDSILDISAVASMPDLQTVTAESQDLRLSYPWVHGTPMPYPTITDAEGAHPTGDIVNPPNSNGYSPPELGVTQPDTCYNIGVVQGTVIEQGSCGGYINWDFVKKLSSGLVESFSGTLRPQGSFV